MNITSREANPLPVSVGRDLVFPAAVTVEVDDLNGYSVVVTVVPAAGRLVAGSVEVRSREGGPAVTGEAIRGVPVAKLVRQASGWVMFVERSHPNGRPAQMIRRQIDKAGVDRIRQAGPTDETLDWVAHAYRVALVLGDPPTGAVEKTFELPRSTAGRWVALARERGFLGKAEGAGKAGG